MHPDRFVIPDSVAPILLTLSLVWLALAFTTHLIYRRISSEPYLRYWAISSYLTFFAVTSFSAAAWLDRHSWPRTIIVLGTLASLTGFVQPAYLLLSARAMRRPPNPRQSTNLTTSLALHGLLLIVAAFRWEFTHQQILRYIMAPRNTITACATLYLGFTFWRHPRALFGGILHRILCPLLTFQAFHQIFSAIEQILGTNHYQGTTTVSGALTSSAIAIFIVLGLMYGITEEASRASAAKSTFLSTLSHELRTPLAGLVGLSQLLTRSPLNPDQRETVRSLDLCAQSILAMVDDILDITRIEAGRLIAHPAPFSPQALVEDLILMLRPTTPASVQLTSSLPPNLPPTLLGDQRLLRQILLNLTGNALKFTPQGSVRIALTYDAAPATPLLRVAVIDTGCGIAPQDIPHLLSPFYQGANVKHSNRRGIGLGLHLCQKWLAALGGSPLHIESQEGAGSTFSFSLPAPVASADAAPGQPPIPSPSRPLQILIVEDNRINQLVLTRLLQSLGHSVQLAPNGADAVDLCRHSSPDLILMDLIMPGIDGVEATQLIRAQATPSAQVPIIALTASTLDAERTRCLNAGMNDFLTKPVSLDKLAAAVNRWSTPLSKPVHNHCE
ncbi:MAG: response regulator [Bryobacterales bacterium]|nr:response regulator [Bryobacterales bacterium]